eukprot:CAMPEP_0195090334 /NCGR_PEP_ID=MMETSP0448-20130528/29353_1 /TAXON_ID=66468 /ORGANISM="Heterocapsa triquestra, Strain CCMP 448" /LENGTH=115 /DNA_ID=CAMNT_0040124149 /DNA_START=129 /DNA_END=477 /DNA_ORIENTATION=-
MTNQASKVQLRALMKKLIPESIDEGVGADAGPADAQVRHHEAHGDGNHVYKVRAEITEIMENKVQLRELLKKIIPESFGKGGEAVRHHEAMEMYDSGVASAAMIVEDSEPAVSMG